MDRGVDPHTVPDPPRVDRRIVMTTGSHHMQTYRVAAEDDGRLFQLPLDWLNDDARWVAREDVFLRPENAPRQMGAWHDDCMYLGHLLDDPYAAVRYVAYRSLRRQAGFGDFLYDYVGPAEDRARARQAAVKKWNREQPSHAFGAAILLNEAGKLDVAELNRLTLERDDRTVESRE